MKKTTLKNVADALEHEIYEINLTDEQIQKARKPIERMIAIKRQ